MCADLSKDFHSSLIVADTHQDTIQRVVDLDHDLTSETSAGYFDIPKMRRGNLSVVYFACCVDYRYIVAGAARHRLEQLLNAVKDLCESVPDDLQIAQTFEDIHGIRSTGRTAVVITVEGGQAIETDLEYIRELRTRSVLSIGLTHFTSNGWADSSTDVKRHGGLSALGRQAIAVMNEVGIMVDVSHVSDEAFWQTLDVSKGAPFASHSVPRGLVDIPRNMSDDMIVALANKGGLIGINFVPEYIYPPYLAALDEIAAKLWPSAATRGPDVPSGVKLMRSRAHDPEGRYNAIVDYALPAPSIEVVLDHVDYVVRLAGSKRVCIGSDHGAVRFDIVGLEDCGKLQSLTAGLLARGYGEEAVRDIMGLNVLRYMSDVAGG